MTYFHHFFQTNPGVLDHKDEEDNDGGSNGDGDNELTTVTFFLFLEVSSQLEFMYIGKLFCIKASFARCKIQDV